MSTLAEIGHAVRQRRTEMGLSQSALARVSGISRATIWALEDGSLENLSIGKAEILLDTIGLRLGVLRPGKRVRVQSMSALEKAAITAGVSYRGDLSADTLLRALSGRGPVPESLRAHFRELLDDAPVSLLAEVAQEIQDSSAIPANSTWRRIRQLARELHCKRRIWHGAARHEPAGSLEGALS
jgi:transcriptional regulator with XRE-family HTH domain